MPSKSELENWNPCHVQLIVHPPEIRVVFRIIVLQKYTKCSPVRLKTIKTRGKKYLKTKKTHDGIRQTLTKKITKGGGSKIIMG